MELSKRMKERTGITFMDFLELCVFKTPKTLLNYNTDLGPVTLPRTCLAPHDHTQQQHVSTRLHTRCILKP